MKSASTKTRLWQLEQYEFVRSFPLSPFRDQVLTVPVRCLYWTESVLCQPLDVQQPITLSVEVTAFVLPLEPISDRIVSNKT